MATNSNNIFKEISILCKAYIEEKKIEGDMSTTTLSDLVCELFQDIIWGLNIYKTYGTFAVFRDYGHAMISILSKFFPSSEFNFNNARGDNCISGTIIFKISEEDETLNQGIVDEFSMYLTEKRNRSKNMIAELDRLRSKIDALNDENFLIRHREDKD